jgi:hypothetical protein
VSAIKNFAVAADFDKWCQHDPWSRVLPPRGVFLATIDILDAYGKYKTDGTLPDGVTADEMIFLATNKDDPAEERLQATLAMNRLIALLARGKHVHPAVRWPLAYMPTGSARLELRSVQVGARGNDKKLEIANFVFDAIERGAQESQAKGLAAKKFKVSKRYVQKLVSKHRQKRT